MIRMNLKSLLSRHADALEAVKRGHAGRDEHPLMLDEYEAAAVARVRQLYRKARSSPARVRRRSVDTGSRHTACHQA
ncbi:hypothetical protein DSL92_07905 [Billgrantia gudaonensis]|uniref:Uncharacterized protein n=1 Tax=Billgrantia gudaonensis TaxID=376427 RepID=A0A432JIC6_9GAMM|nr:hypothetical protein DSL92_07905 [Halomonas gudaonensis]